MISLVAAWAYGCYAWSLFSLVLLTWGTVVMLLQRPAIGRRVARHGLRLMFRLAGMPLHAQGLDRLPAGPHVLLVNHSSFLDALLLIALLPAPPGYAFTTRRQYFSQGLLYPLVRAVGAIVFQHPGKEPHTGNVATIVSALKHGDNLLIFPEGGFTPEAGIQPFHSGAFLAAATAQAPVVTAGLRGARAAMRLGTWLPRRTAITLIIGPILQPSSAARDAARASADTARHIIAALAGETESIGT